MPRYDFRCKNCRQKFALEYKTIQDYDEATPECPECGHRELSRLITSVAIQRPTRNYASMKPEEMVSVMESGDSRQVGEMFQQVGAEIPDMGADFNEATQRLLDGESMDSVEKNLQASEGASAPPLGD